MAATHTPPKPLAERFWAKVRKTESCWLWTGVPNRNGYGRIRLGGVGTRTAFAHRVAYELLVGRIPEGLEIDHLCRVRHCVNPAHLEPVTARINSLRSNNVGGVNAAKTHCVQGHPFDSVNTFVDNRGWRGCRKCHREAVRRYKARKSEATS